MRGAGIEFERAELSWIPQNEVRVEGRDAEKLVKLLDALDDIDDVQQVSSNADIDEEILAQAL
jgi:transcriptional/translational regulatory protein YebC/TACO1